MAVAAHGNFDRCLDDDVDDDENTILFGHSV